MAPDLNEEVEVVVQDSDVITVPIDDTLSNSGEAADAKAVGDALALKADKSELSAAITVNGQSADSQGVIIVTAADTKMDSDDNTTVKAAIEAVDEKTAADIKMSSAAGANTIAQEIAGIGDQTAEDIRMAEGSQTTIAEKIGAMENVDTQNSNDIIALKAKTGADLAVSEIDSQKISEALAERVKTVNANGPDENGNVQVNHTLTADNLTSDQSQTVTGEFARRASGGNASIHTGDAWMSIIRGNRTHVGYVPESLQMTVNAAPREQGETPITATIDRDTFVEAVSGSTTINLTYTTSWSADPATYGVTVTGDPVSGDQITIAYTAEDRGTIIQSDPQLFVSTGWNLYNHELGYAIGLKYADTAQFRIVGAYTAVKFSSTIDGAKTTIVPNDGLFSITANGYIWVEGGDSTSTEVFMTWSDWVLLADAPSVFEAYNEDVIDLRDLMEDHFPYGLLRVGDVRDEIDFNTGIATSNVQRLSYSAENLATAEASGLTYEYDTNYIYLERSSPVDYDMDEYNLDGMYGADDHGLEYFTNTSIAVYAICIYGNNLKNKLERDVLTISQQTLTSGEKTQVRTNIGAASQSAVDTLNSKVSSMGSLVSIKSNMVDGAYTVNHDFTQYRYIAFLYNSSAYYRQCIMYPVSILTGSGKCGYDNLLDSPNRCYCLKTSGASTSSVSLSVSIPSSGAWSGGYYELIGVK